ncbi:MAG: PKD domain-containing protein [Bacteroidales bacterium]|nr:PKD domain-containing protein [Bacteroidales bacterium]
MIKHLIQTSFLLLALIFHLPAATQTYNIQVSGTITSLETGFPVQNHSVMIETFGSGNSQIFNLTTTPNGYYYIDTIQVVNTGSVIVSTIDCEGNPHTQQGSFSPDSTLFIFDFEICTEIPPSCIANFSWLPDPGSFNTIIFTDLSIGVPEEWLWDFGDGNTSSEQNPIHTYNVFGEFEVCLTIWAEAGSCSDNICMDVVIDSTIVDCSNWFVYDTPDNKNFIFTGDADPPANSFFWDFGDGYSAIGPVADHYYELSNQFVEVELTTITFDPVTLDSCIATSSQNIWVAGNGGDCTNWFDFNTMDGYTFEFMGNALPEAQFFQWDFGDGNSAPGPAVTHTYDNSLSGDFPVTLTTYHTFPAGSDTCIAISSQTITVGSNQPCEAFFTWESNPGDPFTVQFFDASLGPVTNYLWDFGDGQSSVNPNPVHTFNSPGPKQVCLEIISDSLGFICSDEFCETIEVDYILTADFSFYLDTLSGQPAQYHFLDNSTGEPDEWLWDFGDGNISNMQNPVHQFEVGSNYEVCLKATRNFPSVGVVNHISCKQLQTPNYFYLGGILLEDNYPINNQSGDTTIVDTGFAYLYKTYGNQLIPLDTTQFYDLGFYFFPSVREGKYIVKAGLTEGSQNYYKWLPAYYPNVLNWQDAVVHTLTNNIFDLDISMPEISEATPGSETIHGQVTNFASNLLVNQNVSDVDVILFDESNTLIGFTKTEDGGLFNFWDLAQGTYTLYAEAAGLYSQAVTIVLDDAMPIPYVMLELYEPNVGLNDHKAIDLLVGNPYPNPVGDEVKINIRALDATQGMYNLFTVNGEIICQAKFKTQGENTDIAIFTGNLKKGIYFIRIDFENQKQTFIRKIIK